MTDCIHVFGVSASVRLALGVLYKSTACRYMAGIAAQEGERRRYIAAAMPGAYAHDHRQSTVRDTVGLTSVALSRLGT